MPKISRRKKPTSDMKLTFLFDFSIAVIVFSGIFLLLFDAPLRASNIRIIGMSAYIILIIALYVGYLIKRNSLSYFLVATLGAQGVISMISNAAFGFQAVWFTNPKFYDAIILYMSTFSINGYLVDFLVLVFYVTLLVFSAVLAGSAYLLAKRALAKEIEKAKKSGAAKLLPN